MDVIDGTGVGLLFVLGALFLIAIFVVAISGFMFLGIATFRRWSRNNNAPLASVPAVVLAKRSHVSGGRQGGATTSYYVTFEPRGGERLELRVSGNQFGLLTERDRGTLTYQGTRFKSFERTPTERTPPDDPATHH